MTIQWIRLPAPTGSRRSRLPPDPERPPYWNAHVATPAPPTALRKENTPYIVAPLDSPEIRMRKKMERAAQLAPNRLWEAPKTEELVNDTGDGAPHPCHHPRRRLLHYRALAHHEHRHDRKARQDQDHELRNGPRAARQRAGMAHRARLRPAHDGTSGVAGANCNEFPLLDAGFASTASLGRPP
jgi:hypothetical protein